jgi:hypothetical protein
MNKTWIGVALAACAILSIAAVSASSRFPALSQGNAQGDSSQEPLTSLVRRARHEFSTGAIARTTVLVGLAGLSMDGQVQQRFVGTVTQFEMEGQHRGDLASMKQVPLASTEGIETHRSLPRASSDSGQDTPNRVGHWLIKPLGQKTWSQVVSADDVVVTYSETTE